MESEINNLSCVTLDFLKFRLSFFFQRRRLNLERIFEKKRKLHNTETIAKFKKFCITIEDNCMLIPM